MRRNVKFSFVDDGATGSKFTIDKFFPILIGIIDATFVAQRWVILEVIDESVADAFVICTRLTCPILHIHSYTRMIHQSAYCLGLNVGEIVVIIIIQHMIPVVGCRTKVDAERMFVNRVRIITLPLLRMFPVVHHLSHRGGNTPRHVRLSIARIHRYLTIVGIALVPLCLDKRADAFALFSGLGSTLCSLFPCLKVCRRLCVCNLTGIFPEPPLEVLGSRVIVERAVVAITQNLTSCLIATCNDKSLVITHIEHIEAGLALAP